jgi:hypothetical protein
VFSDSGNTSETETLGQTPTSAEPELQGTPGSETLPTSGDANATGAPVLPELDASETLFPSIDVDFSGLSDPTLLRYVEDSVYTNLVYELDSDDFFVENVSAIYISKEYLDELAYNSQVNIYFGYTLAEIEGIFQGTKFVFTLGDDRTTTVKEFEKYDDTYDKVIRNVAIGTGVILLCVTVSAVTGGAGVPAVSAIFAASAKSATIFALSSGTFSGVMSGVVTGIQTKDFDSAAKAAALSASEGFMWGAVLGSITGGVSEAIALKGATLNGLTMNEAAVIQKESKYPLDVIKQLKNMEQYDILKKGGLLPKVVDGKTALIRNIDLNYIDGIGRTNLQRIQEGLAPLDPTGTPYELHHIGQQMDSTLAVLTKTEHMQGGNNTIWHELTGQSAIDRPVFDKQRTAFWEAASKILQEGI